MAHLFELFSILMLSDFFAPLFNNTSHVMSLQC